MGEMLLGYPVVPFLVGAVGVALLGRRVGAIIMVLAPLVALAQMVALEPGALAVTVDYYDFPLDPIRVDRLSLAFGYVFAAAATLAGLYGMRMMATGEQVAALVYAGAAVGVVFAGDLMTFFIFWELKAVASAIVIMMRRTATAGRAAMRYLFVHVAGGSALLAGVLWHYAQTGSLAFTAFELTGATALIALACLVNTAAPPLHGWLPDAYPKASVVGTVLLSAYTTKAAVYALARGFAGHEPLLWVGVFMALYGVMYAMMQDDIRKLLAYHIVSQVGFMVAAVGIGTPDAINGAVAHAFAHILYKGLLLMGTGAVLYATGRSLSSRLGGLARYLPWVLVFYMVGAVSISGVPGFSGFVSKELVIHAASEEGLSNAVLLLKIASVGTFLSTALKLPYATWFATPAPKYRPDAAWTPPLRKPGVEMMAAMALAAAANIAIGVHPDLLWDLLPSVNTYTPFSPPKLVETTQLLLLTVLGFWLWKKHLSPKIGTVLDVDWWYRVAPGRLAATIAGRGPAPRDTGEPRGTEVRRPQESVPSVPAITPTWVLGTVVFAAAVLIVIVSLPS